MRSAIILFITIIIFASTSWADESQTVSAPIGREGVIADVLYSDSFFLNDSTTDLIKLSALAAASTYTGSTAELLSDCGFQDVSGPVYTGSSDAGSENDNDHCVVYFGEKKISERTRLIAVIISGYSQGKYEWISDFNLGSEGPHKGFLLATDEVLSLIRQQYSSFDNTLLWITGHSRGAGITNLFAGELLNEEYSDHPDDIFAYGFATPNTTDSPIDTDRIINIVNESDFVCHVPLKSWGFAKNGNTISFSKSKTLSEEFTRKNNKTLHLLKEKKCQELIELMDKCCGGSRKGYYQETEKRVNSLETVTLKAFENTNILASVADDKALQESINEQLESGKIILAPYIYTSTGLAYTQTTIADFKKQGYLKMAVYSYWDRRYLDLTEFILEYKKEITMSHLPETYFAYACTL